MERTVDSGVAPQRRRFHMVIGEGSSRTLRYDASMIRRRSDRYVDFLTLKMML